MNPPRLFPVDDAIPHAVLVHSPTSLELLAFVATAATELPPRRVLLLYLSVDPRDAAARFLHASGTNSSHDAMGGAFSAPSVVLSNGDRLFAADLCPFAARVPLVVIVDGGRLYGNDAALQAAVTSAATLASVAPAPPTWIVQYVAVPGCHWCRTRRHNSHANGRGDARYVDSSPGCGVEACFHGSALAAFLHAPVSALAVLAGVARWPAATGSGRNLRGPRV